MTTSKRLRTAHSDGSTRLARPARPDQPTRPARSLRPIRRVRARHPRPWARRARRGCLLGALTLSVGLAGCGPRRLAVLGPIDDPGRTAEALSGQSRLTEPARIDFSWELNEAGKRLKGLGVARVEPPYRARLDLFLDNGETVMAAALVDDDLRLPEGAPDDILPPVELMWGTLGVFRPVDGARLLGGDRLEGTAQRLRYQANDGQEIHFDLDDGAVQSLDLLQGSSVVQWVRLEHPDGERFPTTATYRNLVDYRELKIARTGVRAAEPFDPGIWDPRQ